MGKLVLNAGSANNDKTGDTLRAGALKIKANFDEIYAALANDGVNISGGNVLKTGNYQDLSNKPVFATVATTGDFYDLTDRPDIGIFVGAPANTTGSEGHVAGNLAFDGNNLYVCREDYVQQDEFTGFTGAVDNDGEVVYTLNAATTSTGTTVTLVESAASYTPEIGWQISDGTTTRTITNAVPSGDNVVLTLDGAFTATAGVSYHIIYTVASGQHVLIVNWDSTDYQDLYDQYTVDQKPAKLYIDADGYGRQVDDVVLNTSDDELYIVYTAGSAIGSFAGLTFTFNQPPIWKSIPWAPTYGDPFPGGGSGSTGDVTFTGTTITGTGNTLTLKADSTADYGLELFNSIDNDTHLRPLQRGKGVAIGFGYGMGSHIRVEGTDGQGGVPNSGDRVGIFAMDTDTSNSAEWIFDNDGSLTFPDSSVQTTALIQGQHLFLMDAVNIAATFTAVNFSLLLATPAIGYTGSDTHSITLPNGAPGQRFVVVNNSSLCTVEIGPYAIPPLGRAEFVFTDGAYGDGWIPLYGTV
jgi:hypothetical protein